MNRIFLRPAPGLTVRDPATKQPLPAEGAEVADTPFWRRRLRRGEVVKATAPRQSTKKES